MNEYAYARRYMGTDVSLSFVVPTEALALTMAEDLFRSIARYESLFSRFLPESELSRLNRSKAARVSREFEAVLRRSTDLVHRTENAFNPLVQVARLGYVRSFAEGPRGATVDATPYDTDITAVGVDTDGTVRLRGAQNLDFGGILKGYLASLLVRHVQGEYPACTGAIVNLGGDLATFGRDADGKPFVFEVYNPVTGHDLPLTVENSALATSGTYARSWETKQGRRHHIVDSKTRENPRTNIVSATVVHEDGAVAEAFTKVFISRPFDEAMRIVGKEPLGFLLILVNGSVVSSLV
ncbi:MAG TPA: FAD:protein FMN transferase [Candidatus Paceibacterota bacterium]|nr:FAD:protein FMN transferase [Candidatus Paceibacterota bacterium]